MLPLYIRSIFPNSNLITRVNLVIQFLLNSIAIKKISRVNIHSIGINHTIFRVSYVSISNPDCKPTIGSINNIDFKALTLFQGFLSEDWIIISYSFSRKSENTIVNDYLWAVWDIDNGWDLNESIIFWWNLLRCRYICDSLLILLN